ncbi:MULTISPECIES: hypothetical protein [unclassified Haloarcula]|jgi:hypothetical protein|uniref:hypothetical protein n=1 Tax=Haloarcula sp. K1 TaxID=1622207 RepID=UPI0007BBBD48|nr:hypothetical protein [Haloarcula sp. K1]KZX46220.1 hypothetical protein AV929_15720 [Haloarcula sp. K1]
MSESQRSTLSRFATSTESDHDSDKWPVQVNGHTVIRVEPQKVVYGSVDEELAFKCEDCDKLVRIPDVRAVPDHEYAENRFNTISCTTNDGIFS